MKTPCYHCTLSLDSDDCGTATVNAIYIDADGETDGIVRMICVDCAGAGSASGPGYSRCAQSTLVDEIFAETHLDERLGEVIKAHDASIEKIRQ